MLTEICVALNICIKKKRNFFTQYSKILPKETRKRRANETHGKQKKEKKMEFNKSETKKYRKTSILKSASLKVSNIDKTSGKTN